MTLHLPIGSLKTHSRLEPVPKCEPSTYQPIADDITTAPSVNLVFKKSINSLFPDMFIEQVDIHCD